MHRVGILSGGTARSLTALALRKRIPAVQVEAIASRDIPPIGVGESTPRHIVGFLHDELRLEPGPFHREVDPTWKLGTRLYRGMPGDQCIHFPHLWQVGLFGTNGIEHSEALRVVDEHPEVLGGGPDPRAPVPSPETGEVGSAAHTPGLRCRRACTLVDAPQLRRDRDAHARPSTCPAA